MKPRLLDLFCGAGGAAVGYQNAGFYVVGVDHKPQPRYPFEFHQLDAFDLLRRDDRWWNEVGNFDAIHASPLWWSWTAHARQNGVVDDHPDDVGPALELLEARGLPFVLEIGTTSPQEAVTICGVSCGLRVTRHMRFVTNWPLMVPPCSHKHGGCADGLYLAYRGSSPKRAARVGWRPIPFSRKSWRKAAGVEWMNGREGELAVPPAYTELIGTQLRAYLKATVAA